MVNQKQQQQHYSLKNNDGHDKIETSPSTMIMKKKSKKHPRKQPSIEQRKLIRQISNNQGGLKRCSSDLLLEKIKHYEIIDEKTARKNSLTQYLDQSNGDPSEKQRRSSSLCRVTGSSFSMDEPHYFPLKNDFPRFDQLKSCQITMKHNVLGDKFHFPVFNATSQPTGRENPQITYGLVPLSSSYSRSCNNLDDQENPTKLLRKKFKDKKLKKSSTTSSSTDDDSNEEFRFGQI